MKAGRARLRPALLAALLAGAAGAGLAQDDDVAQALARERAALREIEAGNARVRAELERLHRALRDSDAEIEAIVQRIEALQRDLAEGD